MPALLSGERVLLSTATKALQDQLYGRDLPRLKDALGLPVQTALLKGRASYLCLHRLEQARFDASLEADRMAQRTLAKVEQWSQTTRSGDLAELPGLDERSPLIPLVTSTRDNCLGSECPKFRACHVNLARRDAMGADVVVVNHHLFFADMAVRESGMAELLPSVRTVIFDEAHQINETGVQFLGGSCPAGNCWSSGATCWPAACNWRADWWTGPRWRPRWSTPRATCAWWWAGCRAASCAGTGRPPSRWLNRNGLTHSKAWPRPANRPSKRWVRWKDSAPDFQRLRERAGTLAGHAAFFSAPCASGSVRWLDVGNQARLVESPLDIADAVRDKLMRVDDGQAAARRQILDLHLRHAGR